MIDIHDGIPISASALKRIDDFFKYTVLNKKKISQNTIVFTAYAEALPVSTVPLSGDLTVK
jgi:hypothetical protein